jgi:cytochrome P450
VATGIVNLYGSRDEYYRDPHAVLRALREAGPVHRVRMPNGLPAWLVVRRAAVEQVLADPAMASELRFVGAEPDEGGSSTLGMNTCDEPRHGQLRGLVAAAFRPSEIARLAPRVEEICAGLLDGMRAGQRVDLVEDYAARLTLELVVELLGVPLVDRAAFRRWTYQAVFDGDDSVPLAEARAHLADVLRRTLRDGDGSSLIERVAHADRAGTGRPVSFDELVSMAYLFLLAGHESSTDLITNTVVTVLGSDGLAGRVRDGAVPFEELVEESLRYDPPVMTSTGRLTTGPVAVGGQTIPGGGERVFLSWAAAERDPAAVADPDTFHPARRHRRTMAFGGSTHYCLGAGLARLEATVALRALFGRFPALRLAAPPRRWPSTVTRGIQTLLVDL